MSLYGSINLLRLDSRIARRAPEHRELPARSWSPPPPRTESCAYPTSATAPSTSTRWQRRCRTQFDSSRVKRTMLRPCIPPPRSPRASGRGHEQRRFLVGTDDPGRSGSKVIHHRRRAALAGDPATRDNRAVTACNSVRSCPPARGCTHRSGRASSGQWMTSIYGFQNHPHRPTRRHRQRGTGFRMGQIVGSLGHVGMRCAHPLDCGERLGTLKCVVAGLGDAGAQ